MLGWGKASGEDKDTDYVVTDNIKADDADLLDKFKRPEEAQTKFAQPTSGMSFSPSSGNKSTLPSHMDDSQKIIINPRTGKKGKNDLEKLERNGMTMFTEKLSATIGPSYVGAFFVGGFMGLMVKPPLRNRRTKRLLINSYLNNVGKTSLRFGNNVGGAILMYITMGKFLNFLF